MIQVQPTTEAPTFLPRARMIMKSNSGCYVARAKVRVVRLIELQQWLRFVCAETYVLRSYPELLFQNYEPSNY